jgi:hypothetical protein
MKATVDCELLCKFTQIHVFKREHRTLTDVDHEVRNIMQNSCDERSERILHGQ